MIRIKKKKIKPNIKKKQNFKIQVCNTVTIKNKRRLRAKEQNSNKYLSLIQKEEDQVEII